MKTDSQLQRDVMKELEWEPRIDAAHIGVAAKAPRGRVSPSCFPENGSPRGGAAPFAGHHFSGIFHAPTP